MQENSVRTDRALNNAREKGIPPPSMQSRAPEFQSPLRGIRMGKDAQPDRVPGLRLDFLHPFHGIEQIFRQLGTMDEVVGIVWSILTQTKGSYLYSERASGWVTRPFPLFISCIDGNFT